ncbi:MAG: 16S rRNA methyltransferase [Chloroflexi bacterium]|nr:16S rRNA methyltransferase [Chloroflexota bacterium]|tara:strand:+ start:2476 stop:3225 length:750 start_codon:yes stop_codon:yes gene_type:complete
MQINRFYLDKIIFDQDGILKLPDSISMQLIYVLRCKVNDQAVIFDGSGFDYKVKIVNITNKICSVKFLEKISLDTDNKIKITIFISLIKQNRFEVALQKCTELGVFAFVPFYSSRSIFQLDKKSSSIGNNKISRWKSIIQEASEQCGRPDIPRFFDPVSYEIACKKSQDCFSIILWENEEKIKLKSVLQSLKGSDHSINIFVGPEGGFSSDEIKLANSIGIKSASLGDLILRSETAAISAISNVFYELS